MGRFAGFAASSKQAAVPRNAEAGGGSDLIRVLDEGAAVEVAHQREQDGVPPDSPGCDTEPERQPARELCAGEHSEPEPSVEQEAGGRSVCGLLQPR